MLGVPYSPMVPSLTKCASGTTSLMAVSRFRLLMTLFCYVHTQCCRSIIE